MTEQARAILEAAGVPPDVIEITGSHPNWLVRVRGFGVSATDAGDESMDTPEECAAALVRAMGGVYGGVKQEQIPSHETDSETVPEVEHFGDGLAGKAQDGGDLFREDSPLGSGGGEGDAVSNGDAQAYDHQGSEQPVEVSQADDGDSVDEVPQPVREESGSSADPSPGPVDSGDESAAFGSDGSAEDGAADLGGSLLANDGSAQPGDSDILDAEYDEAADAELLALEPPPEPAIEGADFDPRALPEPDPEDFDPEPVEDEGPGAFIFGDNLANDRLMRQGQIANHAAILIAELDTIFDADAYAAAYNTVTTKLEKHTGLFHAETEEDRQAYQDFLAYETIRNQRKAVESARDAKIDFIRTASREEVATFDPEADWP